MSMAIKYHMKKKANMANGGACDAHGTQMCGMCHGGAMAEGGDVKGVHKQHNPRAPQNGISDAGASVLASREPGMREDFRPLHVERAKKEHKKVLGEMHSMRGQDRKYLADGGDVHKYAQGDMVEDIMKKRGELSGFWAGNPAGGGKPKVKEMDDDHYYSKGGQVANDTGMGMEADKLPNQFDDLVLRDDLEQHYTGANSGDEIGDKQEDEDRRDVIAQIMKSRRKKDRLPNPL